MNEYLYGEKMLYRYDRQTDSVDLAIPGRVSSRPFIYRGLIKCALLIVRHGQMIVTASMTFDAINVFEVDLLVS